MTILLGFYIIIYIPIGILILQKYVVLKIITVDVNKKIHCNSYPGKQNFVNNKITYLINLFK